MSNKVQTKSDFARKPIKKKDWAIYPVQKTATITLTIQSPCFFNCRYVFYNP